MSEASEPLREPAPRPGPLPLPDPEGLQNLSDWIVERGLLSNDLGALIRGLGEGFQRLGLPVWRFHASIPTLHPTLVSVGWTWWRGGRFEPRDYDRDQRHDPTWHLSPFRTMLKGGLTRLRRRLDGPGPEIDYPVLADFREQGGTDWLARYVRFSGEDQPTGLPGMMMSWVADRPGGFTDGDLAAIERLVPRIALTCYRLALQRVARNLLDTYIGADAGRRVLAGQIQRGAATPIQAAVLFADLRGFTRLADEAPGGKVLEELNRSLGQVVDAVGAHGGEVLKFLGDGLLAIFDVAGRDSGTVCRAALAAAREAVQGNARLNAERATRCERALMLDIALHLGEMSYGNVGSAHRLDFTVIGPAVNEASRIETFCTRLERDILTSATFARACGEPLVSLGMHRLRGVIERQELFTPA